MNLSINVTGATLNDLITIFYRLGEPGMQEVWEAEKVDSLQQYINQGCSLSDALDKFEADVHKKLEELDQQGAVDTQPVQPQITSIKPDPAEVYTPPTLDPNYGDIPRIKPAQPTNKLHLDSAPVAPSVVPNPQPAMNLDDKLRQVATSLIEKLGSNGPKRLRELLEPYGAKSLLDLNSMLKEEFLNKLQMELAA